MLTCMVFFSTIVSWLIQFFPNFSPALLYVGGLILFIVVSILEYKPHFSQEKEKENEKLNKAPHSLSPLGRLSRRWVSPIIRRTS